MIQAEIMSQESFSIIPIPPTKRSKDLLGGFCVFDTTRDDSRSMARVNTFLRTQSYGFVFLNNVNRQSNGQYTAGSDI